MLVLTLPETDQHPSIDVKLEHSLAALSKWESIYEKPFFAKEPKTEDETKNYLLQMVIGDEVPPDFLNRIRPTQISIVNGYINSKQTATWFTEQPGQNKPSSEIPTSELIYYWMVSFKIPFEAENWHLNRLITLIKICGIKQAKPKKMGRHEQAAQMRRLNEQRRNALGTSG